MQCTWVPLTLHMVLLRVCLLQERDEVSSSLPCSILGPGQDVSPRQRNRDTLLLDWRGHLVALLKDTHEQLPLETVVFKFISFSFCDVLKEQRIAVGEKVASL